MEKPEPKEAITIKEISGDKIKTIPIGTKFKVTYIHKHLSMCLGLEIGMVWNDEYKLLEE